MPLGKFLRRGLGSLADLIRGPKPEPHPTRRPRQRGPEVEDDWVENEWDDTDYRTEPEPQMAPPPKKKGFFRSLMERLVRGSEPPYAPPKPPPSIEDTIIEEFEKVPESQLEGLIRQFKDTDSEIMGMRPNHDWRLYRQKGQLRRQIREHQDAPERPDYQELIRGGKTHTSQERRKSRKERSLDDFFPEG